MVGQLMLDSLHSSMRLIKPRAFDGLVQCKGCTKFECCRARVRKLANIEEIQ